MIPGSVRDASELGPVTLPGTASHVVTPPGFAEPLRIDVSVPFGYETSTDRYPVVYLLDGHWFFPIVSQSVRWIGLDGEMPPVIVVGLTYALPSLTPPQLEARVYSLRCRDLTPILDASEWWVRAGSKPPEQGIETGHADRFLDVIEHCVKPLIRSRYRANGDETLAGFSFGGLFALHTLFRHTDRFNRYVAGSPSLWWDEGVVFEFESDYARTHQDLGKRLFLSVGECEESGFFAPCKMVTHLKSLAQTLAARHYPSLKCESVILPGETHSTGAAPALLKGLLSVFR
jgi:uncharacterized protein